jgi:hypothetical protein
LLVARWISIWKTRPIRCSGHEFDRMHWKSHTTCTYGNAWSLSLQKSDRNGLRHDLLHLWTIEHRNPTRLPFFDLCTFRIVRGGSIYGTFFWIAVLRRAKADRQRSSARLCCIAQKKNVSTESRTGLNHVHQLVAANDCTCFVSKSDRKCPGFYEISGTDRLFFVDRNVLIYRRFVYVYRTYTAVYPPRTREHKYHSSWPTRPFNLTCASSLSAAFSLPLLFSVLPTTIATVVRKTLWFSAINYPIFFCEPLRLGLNLYI